MAIHKEASWLDGFSWDHAGAADRSDETNLGAFAKLDVQIDQKVTRPQLISPRKCFPSNDFPVDLGSMMF